MSIPFSADKASAIVALRMGAEFETRRLMKPQPAESGGQRIGHIGPELAGDPLEYRTWLDLSAEHKSTCEYDYNAQIWRPRYIPGRVYPLGFPHQAWGKGTRNEQVYVPCLRGIIRRDAPNVLSVGDVAGVEWPECPMRAGYVMPAYAYTRWADVLLAEPQRVGDITEDQAVAELVEHSDIPLGPTVVLRGWRDYASGNDTLETARESFFSLLNKVHGKPVPRSTWAWRYRVRLVPKPSTERNAA